MALLGNGSSPHISRLAFDLAARGHNIHILSEDRYGPFANSDGVAFHTFDEKANALGRIRAVYALLARLRPNVLHSHYVNNSGYLGLAAGFHPHVMHAWGSDIFEVRNSRTARKLKTAIALRSADWVLSPSTFMRAEINRLAGSPLKHNEAWAWGIDTAHFAPTADTAAFRQSHGMTGGPWILSPRALLPLYNQDVMVRAWPAVLAEFPSARLAIVRFQADGKFEIEVRALVSQLGIDKSVHWLDSLPYGDLPLAYSTSDAVVSIPTTDAPALTVMEAMACAKPVIVTDLPTLREVITDAEHGYFVDPRSAEAVGGAIRQVLRKNAAAGSAFTPANRERIVKLADRKTSLDRLEEIYRTVNGQKTFGFVTTIRNLAGL